jgi:hypothetical protein
MAFAADAILEHQRALALALLGHARHDLCPSTVGLPTVTFSPSATITPIDLDLRADFLRQMLNLHLLADLGPILIACYFEYCVHERLHI